MTTVVNKRTGEPYDVYIGRPSIWGNPFRAGIHGTREEVIEKYRNHVGECMLSGEITLEQLASLYGKRLACWCAPLACHGDVLVELAEWAHNELKGGK